MKYHSGCSETNGLKGHFIRLLNPFFCSRIQCCPVRSLHGSLRM
jgi:hypothetical protein